MILSLSGRARDGMDVQAMTAWLTALGDANSCLHRTIGIA
jgi:hypothetical protein